MIPAINEFFDKVLVMAEDKVMQENRLGLLQRIAALAKRNCRLEQNWKDSRISQEQPTSALLFLSRLLILDEVP